MGRDRERQLEDAIDQAATHLRKQNPVEAFRVLQPHCRDEVMTANPPEVVPGDKAGTPGTPGETRPGEAGAATPVPPGADRGDRRGEHRGGERRPNRPGSRRSRSRGLFG
jgi:hypothetical protein